MGVRSSNGTRHRASLSNVIDNSISYPTSQLQLTNITLSTYTGESLMILCICDAHIDYQSQSQILPLLVMHRHGPIFL